MIHVTRRATGSTELAWFIPTGRERNKISVYQLEKHKAGTQRNAIFRLLKRYYK